MSKKTMAALDPGMVERFRRAAGRTWEAIAPDLFAALAEDGKGTIPGAHVRELVVDADRLESFGADPEAAAWFGALDRPTQDALLKARFPERRYL